MNRGRDKRVTDPSFIFFYGSYLAERRLWLLAESHKGIERKRKGESQLRFYGRSRIGA